MSIECLVCASNDGIEPPDSNFKFDNLSTSAQYLLLQPYYSTRLVIVKAFCDLFFLFGKRLDNYKVVVYTDIGQSGMIAADALSAYLIPR